jgi:hypothetical protein
MSGQLNRLKSLEERFKDRYHSYKKLKGREDTAKAWKRAWLDVKKEIRDLE